MTEITRRSSTRGLPGWFFGRCGSNAAYASSDNQNRSRIAASALAKPNANANQLNMLNGSSTYEFSTPDDGRTVHIFEHYRSSAAIVDHVNNTFAHHASRFGALATTESITNYGDPDASVREIVDQWTQST